MANNYKKKMDTYGNENVSIEKWTIYSYPPPFSLQTVFV